MGLLEPIYHTSVGALVVHLFFVLSWTVGGVVVALVCCGLASYTYGLSFLIFASVAIEKLQMRRALAVVCLALDCYVGPRSSSLPGFGKYWTCWAAMVAICYVNWFLRLKGRPWFVKLMQDLDFAQWYQTLELRGALDDIQKEKSCFGFHPHGLLCIGFALNGIWNKKFRELSGVDTKYLIDKVLREDNPFFTVICDLHGGVETLNKSNLQKYMAAGTNVSFVPGGFEDATVAAFGKDRTVMRKRQGFIKYALQHGYRLHPIYTFGECESHYTWTGQLDFRLWLNKFGIPAVVFFGFPFFPILPRREVKAFTYVGEAIQLPKIENPSKEEVQKWHGAYLDALQKLFEDNKKEVGLPDTAQLEIF